MDPICFRLLHLIRGPGRLLPVWSWSLWNTEQQNETQLMSLHYYSCNVLKTPSRQCAGGRQHLSKYFYVVKKKNKTKLMCMESAEYPCCVLSDMVIFAGTWAVTMGDTQMKQIWKAIQVTKTGACISCCYQLSGHLWSPHFEISLSMFIYKILRK